MRRIGWRRSPVTPESGKGATRPPIGNSPGRRDAAATTLAAIAEVNRQYEERFGFTYIVYASGKTAEEMLAIAESRMGSTREQEIETASVEQRAITATRLRRMLCEGDQP